MKKFWIEDKKTKQMREMTVEEIQEAEDGITIENLVSKEKEKIRVDEDLKILDKIVLENSKSKNSKINLKVLEIIKEEKLKKLEG
ncbi:MAG: hypothetical protein ACRC0V_03840 [Fusobacteriaceae bacterium]